MDFMILVGIAAIVVTFFVPWYISYLDKRSIEYWRRKRAGEG